MFYITAAVSLAFLSAAMGWSVWRVAKGSGIWRWLHAAILMLAVLGAISVYRNDIAIGVIVGLPLMLLSLAAMLYDKTSGRWLAFVPFFLALLLAAGVPFVTG